MRSWLLWTQRQFNLDPFPLEYFSMDGMTFCSLTETDFKQRAPHCGEILYAQLDIWKTGMNLCFVISIQIIIFIKLLYKILCGMNVCIIIT